MKRIMLRRMPLLGCVAALVLMLTPSSARAADFVVITKQVVRESTGRRCLEANRRLLRHRPEWLKVTVNRPYFRHGGHWHRTAPGALNNRRAHGWEECSFLHLLADGG